ncbi:MAG: hypothetical protein HOI47_19920 [Candidatus Scalindua sp.]|jgi:hypothetical protein|nr:hypothetical protein [Candidatus Scalindua sp.]MBT5305414.1 hypothetical protein [Candidatus Scalindua sp.]MBT6045896.1 hypothetical protein [Candidatus Scalindua sp.]MBT6228915.1 hypothetical protein [Candidatus Scalindua sp.]MBT7211823.1 hypothetical protein [Candidatus Scalindua sp.]
MRKFLILMLLVIISSGCTASVIRSGNVINPTGENVRRGKVFNKDFDDLWKTVVKACTVADISIKTSEKLEREERESGIIIAERSVAATEELRETFETGRIELTYDKKKPAGWMDYTASQSYVAAKGKTVKSEVVESDLLSVFEEQGVLLFLSYNIYVQEIDNNNSKVVINIFAYPAQPEIKYSSAQTGFWAGQQLTQEAKVDISQAKFLSKGKFEDDFFVLIKKIIEKG